MTILHHVKRFSCQIALTLVPDIGDVHAKTLVSRYDDSKSIFIAKGMNRKARKALAP